MFEFARQGYFGSLRQCLLSGVDNVYEDIRSILLFYCNLFAKEWRNGFLDQLTGGLKSEV
jgi:hypothetical protein